MKVLSVVGVRPEFVVAMPVSRALADGHEHALVHTGQHYDEALSERFFDELALPTPAHELGVGSAPRARQVARVRTALAPVLREEAPDAVVVYGDTNSTLGAALAAADADATLAHVEAGVRSFDPAMPEERNRRAVDRRADLLLAPTGDAVRNLRAERISGAVRRVGDVRRDAFELVRGTARSPPSLLDEVGLDPGGYALATVHRAANTDDPSVLRSIFRGLAGSDPPVLLPVHPRTRRRLREFGLDGWASDRIAVVDPVGYPTFLGLIADAGCVATDSGGVQREAMLAGTPCVTLRETTEWPETVRRGYNRLAGTDPQSVRRAVDGAMGRSVGSPTLDGPVAPQVVAALETATDAADATESSTDASAPDGWIESRLAGPTSPRRRR